MCQVWRFRTSGEPQTNPISFTPAEASFCQKFNILEQNAQVGETVLFELAHKFNTTGISFINEVLAYVNHTVTSTVNAGIAKWIQQGGIKLSGRLVTPKEQDLIYQTFGNP